MSEKIVQIAKSYIGKTEISGNKGFTDKKFEKRMKDTGWYSGLSWCAFFSELVWKEAYAESSELVKKLDKLFSGSATTTYKNFDLAVDFKVSPKPVPGALAVWRYGNGWQGHIGVVTEVLNDGTFKCVEGNTNDVGGREGYIVAEKHRKLVKPYQAKGLNLVGFVLPC
jgi:hypothetical protein